MNIVNLVHIGNEVYRIDELPKEKQAEIWQRLNQQALEGIGYRKRQATA